MNLQSWSFTATGTGAVKGPVDGDTLTVQLKATATGAVQADAVIEGAMVAGDANGWATIATLTASGTNSAQDSAVAITSWPFLRVRLTTLTGTAAAAEVLSNYA